MHFGGLMKSYKGEQGSVTVVALLVLVVLTILGITITRTTTLDLRIGTNELMRRQSFYVAEGGVYREAAVVGQGNYGVSNIYSRHQLAKQRVDGDNAHLDSGLTDAAGDIQTGKPLPGDIPCTYPSCTQDQKTHRAVDGYYNLDLFYISSHLPPKGYSADQFSRYDFDIQTDRDNVNVGARFYRIGPKAK
jgi:hypothetical protein